MPNEVLVIVRSCADDFEAVMFCQAATRHGFDPFSVVHVPGKGGAADRWHVFAKGPADLVSYVDDTYASMLTG